MIGADFSGSVSDYSGVSARWAFLLITFRNSIGDSSAPGYSIWTDDPDLSSEEKD